MGTIAVLNLAMIAVISSPPSFSNASQPIRGIVNPILAMEVVRNVREVDLVLSDAPSPDRETMRIKQYADFGFIASYAALYIVMALTLAAYDQRTHVVAIAAAILGALAAIFDIIENLGILRIVNVDLAHTTQAMIDAIRYPSLIKWFCASLGLGLLGVLLIRARRTSIRIVGALELLAALLGLCGVPKNALLQWMQIPLLGGLVGLAILYFRPHWHRVRHT